ncbi:MAG: ferritin-like domain-containing protein [Thermodesulfobacteriota bacterium]|nr:MAG: ferritin-like domain-containing protein [Thermodesulfobacteriota bacterium]
MENKEIAKELISLCKIDIDAVHAYNQALRHLDIAGVRNEIESFRGDHERHIKELSDAIRTFDEEPPEFSKDFKGYLLDAFTRVRSLTGAEGALKALKGGEEMTNRNYSNAVKMAFPPPLKSLIEKNYRDEQRHLNYIEQAIRDQVWKKAA